MVVVKRGKDVARDLVRCECRRDRGGESDALEKGLDLEGEPCGSKLWAEPQRECVSPSEDVTRAFALLDERLGVDIAWKMFELDDGENSYSPRHPQGCEKCIEIVERHASSPAEWSIGRCHLGRLFVLNIPNLARGVACNAPKQRSRGRFGRDQGAALEVLDEPLVQCCTNLLGALGADPSLHRGVDAAGAVHVHAHTGFCKLVREIDRVSFQRGFRLPVAPFCAPGVSSTFVFASLNYPVLARCAVTALAQSAVLVLVVSTTRS